MFIGRRESEVIRMSLSEIFIKVIGLILAVVGLSLLTAAVGLPLLTVGFTPVWAEIIVGVCFLGAGIYIIRGGNINL